MKKEIFNAITLLTSFKGQLYELLVYTISHASNEEHLFIYKVRVAVN